MSALVWFRQDLRIEDNPALWAACERGGAVVPVYVWHPPYEAPWELGPASRNWLRRSLGRLTAQLHQRHSRLIVREGEPAAELLAVARATGARTVCMSRRHEPAVAERDAKVVDALESEGIEVRVFDSALLFAPDRIRTQDGRPYQVYTPFWNACNAAGGPPEPVAEPPRMHTPDTWPASASLDCIAGEDAGSGLWQYWDPGEKEGRDRLGAFLEGALAEYPEDRDVPGRDGTSRLSAHLHFGEVSPRRVWWDVKAYAAANTKSGTARGEEAFLRQLAWREFAYHLLIHFPHTPGQPLREAYADFPWREDAGALEAWRQGRTGYPMVDAGMRQLRETGWMHNRVRMTVASFLTKHLLIPWQKGARWFWDCLVDADLANNTLGWQWTAGCGADAAPYFRVLSPMRQGERFDKDGAYVREWVPELGDFPAKWLHAPWEAPDDAHTGASRTYPRPVVEHKHARERALSAYEHIKNG